jgi:hypothetical protein
MDVCIVCLLSVVLIAAPSTNWSLVQRSHTGCVGVWLGVSRNLDTEAAEARFGLLRPHGQKISKLQVIDHNFEPVGVVLCVLWNTDYLDYLCCVSSSLPRAAVDRPGVTQIRPCVWGWSYFVCASQEVNAWHVRVIGRSRLSFRMCILRNMSTYVDEMWYSVVDS